jgi:hypothetical protein
MNYTDHCISFSTREQWIVEKDYDVLRWLFVKKKNNYRNFGIRVISSERTPYTLEYIQNLGKSVVDDFSVENCLVLRQFPEMLSNPSNAKYYVTLLDFGECSVRINSIVDNNADDFKSYQLLINSIKIQKDFALSKLEIITKGCQYCIDEYIAFFKGLLHWKKEKTLLMLEGIHRHLRDDMEDYNSWFYHEHELYWAVYFLFQEIEGLDDFWFCDGNIVQDLIDIVLENKKSCTSHNTNDWQRIRDKISLILHSRQPTLELGVLVQQF